MWFSPYLGIGCGGGGGGGGSLNGLVHNLLTRFPTLGSSKIEVSETYVSDIVTAHYDHPKYVKHDLGRIYVFFTLFGCWVRRGGGGLRVIHNLFVQFFTLDGSKIEVFESYFGDVVIT